MLLLGFGVRVLEGLGDGFFFIGPDHVVNVNRAGVRRDGCQAAGAAGLAVAVADGGDGACGVADGVGVDVISGVVGVTGFPAAPTA